MKDTHTPTGNEGSRDVDYGEHAAPDHGALEKALGGIKTLYEDARKLEIEIADNEQKAKDLRAKYRGIVEDALPKLMRGHGMDSFTTDDGVTVALTEKFATAVPAARREEAWDWMEENGHADAVKVEVSLAFGVGEKELADQTAARLSEEHKRAALRSRKVEPATLKSIIKKLIEKGKPVPADLFGVRQWETAEFKRSKRK